jgi:hypothetical protein
MHVLRIFTAVEFTFLVLLRCGSYFRSAFVRQASVSKATKDSLTTGVEQLPESLLLYTYIRENGHRLKYSCRTKSLLVNFSISAPGGEKFAFVCIQIKFSAV